jgi:hypothetical protein
MNWIEAIFLDKNKYNTRHKLNLSKQINQIVLKDLSFK